MKCYHIHVQWLNCATSVLVELDTYASKIQ